MSLHPPLTQPLTEERIHRILSLLPEVKQRIGPDEIPPATSLLHPMAGELMDHITIATAVMEYLLARQEDPIDFFKDYYRLMDIFCIVQMGGVQAQLAATQAFAAQAQQEIATEFEQTQFSSRDPQRISTRSPADEVADLQTATDWRLAQLNSITPAEEAAVQACLPAIYNCLAVN